MAKQIMTVILSDTAMRFMISDGKQITDWSEVEFEPGQIEDSVVNPEQADRVADKIKQILDIKSISVRRILLGIGGIRCLTRPVLLPKLPREILDEAVRREAERLLPVPLDDLYMTYQTIPAPEGKSQVFITAIPKRIVDPLMEMLDKAGLKPVFMDLKPLLLARVSREETAILVDVQDGDFDIVVMANGIPQPIRTIPFAIEGMTPTEKMAMIREELDRTITFFNSNNPESPIAVDLPIHLSGNIGDADEFCRLLGEEVRREVHLLPSPVEVPPGFNPLQYMANIGLLIQESSGRTSGPSVVALNTLPPQFLPQSVSSMNILKLLGFAFAIILLIAGVFVVQSLSSELSSNKLTLETTRTTLQKGQLETQILEKQIKDLNTEVEVLESERQDLLNALTVLELQSSGLNLDIKATMDNVPGSISLTNIRHLGGVLRITGIAPSPKTVDGYISQLSGTGRFTDIQVEQMVLLEDETHEFILTATLLVETDWISSVGVILGNLPGTITIQFAATEERALTLTGNSPDENILMRYLEKLDMSGKFSEIVIEDITRIEDGSMDFNVILRIGDDNDDDV